MKSRKELVEEYKQRKPVAGVFQIKNNKTGRVLIDDSSDVHSKWNRHRTELRFGTHRNKALQKDWNELGEEHFEFSVLSELEQKEDENLNLRSEAKLLREMLEEELAIPNEMRY